MKKILLLMLMFSLVKVAIASDESASEAIEQLLVISKVETRFSPELMTASEIRRHPELKPFEDIMLEFFAKYLDYQRAKSEIISLYRKNFSDNELREIVAFYQTTAGGKVIDIMPKLNQEIAQIGMARVQSNISELEEAIKASSKK